MVSRRRPRHLYEVLRAVTGSPETPLWALAPWLAGALLGNWLTNLLPWWGILSLIGALIGAFWVYFQWYPRGPSELTIHIEPQQPKQVPGLILPLSPICVPDATETERKRLEQLWTTASEHSRPPLSDNDQRFLLRSNLSPALAALEHHYAAGSDQLSASLLTLRDVWIITTEEPKGRSVLGSSSAGVEHLLQWWFFSRHPEATDRVRFHLDSYEGRPLRIEATDYTGLATLVDHIYKKAPYKSDQIIADITPGTKVMSLALAMGCLPPKRTMQYMIAARDPCNGEVLRDAKMVPKLIDIDPYVEEIYS